MARPHPVIRPRPVLLMTRPRQASERFVASLPPAMQGAVQICVSPLLEIVPATAPPLIGQVAGVIFSSSNGVEVAKKLGIRSGSPAFCVGQRTTESAHSAGWNAHFCGDTANALVRELSQSVPEGRLVHLSGTYTRGDIAGRLGAAGVQVVNHAIYDQRPIALSDEAQAHLCGSNKVFLPLFSPRTAGLFASGAACSETVHAVAISPAAAEPLGRLPVASMRVAPRPSAQSLRQALLDLSESLSTLEGGRGSQ